MKEEAVRWSAFIVLAAVGLFMTQGLAMGDAIEEMLKEQKEKMRQLGGQMTCHQLQKAVIDAHQAREWAAYYHWQAQGEEGGESRDIPQRREQEAQQRAEKEQLRAEQEHNRLDGRPCTEDPLGLSHLP